MPCSDKRFPAGTRRLAASLVLALALPAGAADPTAPIHPAFEAASEGDFSMLRAALPGLPRDWADLARARLAAGQLDEARAIGLAENFLGRRDADSCERAPAHAVIADAAFASARYARAATAAQAHQGLLELCGGSDADLAGVATMVMLAERLSAAPPQRVVRFSPASAPYARDKVGLPRAQVDINGHSQDSVLDTGANLSVVSASTAKRLGLRHLGRAAVGSSSRASVAVDVAIADRLAFAGLVLENVVFLVLDDAQLEMPVPGGYRIDAIIGFPVFRALKRVRFDHDGILHAEPGAGDAQAPGNLVLAGSDLFVDVRVGGHPAALHLDTGGNASSLSSAFARAHPDVLRGLEQTTERLGGAGGTTERTAAKWRQAPVQVGDRTATLPKLSIVVRDSTDVDGRGLGVLGGDVLGAFEYWTLDLERMQLELGAPRTP